MSFRTSLLATCASMLAFPAIAGDVKIMIHDAYARSGAKSGAAFFHVMNNGKTDDRLISASSDVAKRVELHTHLEDANGVMKMREIENGITIPAGGTHMLKRGGDHVMLMGLHAPLAEGAFVDVTLTFEHAGDISVSIPVDNERRDAHSGHSD